MLEFRSVPNASPRPQSRVACCIVTRSGREKYLAKTLKSLRTQQVDILLWANGPIDSKLAEGCVYFHQHPFNAGQHVAQNEMLDECVRRGYDWHIRVDDDCFITTRTWLKKLLVIQDKVKKQGGSHAVLGINIAGLENPPKPITRRTYGYEFGNKTMVESMGILGGIFRMTPMSMIRYFRWDERQAMGFGDATQFASFCSSIGIPMFRVSDIHATHGGSTQSQTLADSDWNYEHDMLQFIPLGL